MLVRLSIKKIELLIELKLYDCEDAIYTSREESLEKGTNEQYERFTNDVTSKANFFSTFLCVFYLLNAQI